MRERNRWRAIAQVAPLLRPAEVQTLVAIHLILCERGLLESQMSREAIGEKCACNRKVVGLAMQSLIKKNIITVFEEEAPRRARVVGLNFNAMRYRVRAEQKLERPRDRSPA